MRSSPLDDLPEPPPYFPVMKRLNKQGPAILGGIPQPESLDIDATRAVQSGARGAVTPLDVRPYDAFGRGFLAGSLNIGLGPSLPNWAGWAVSYDQPIVLVVGAATDVEEAVTWLIRIGLDDVAGYVVADVEGWRQAGLAVQQVEQIQVTDAAARVRAGELQVLDVRNADEWKRGHVPGARHMPVGHLAQGALNGLEPHRPVAVMCAAGYRSSLGTSVLKARGIDEVYNITGGFDAWLAKGLEIER
jgi:hydroxyacylglutathione hydrolase